jgi:chromosome segregation ATPase
MHIDDEEKVVEKTPLETQRESIEVTSHTKEEEKEEVEEEVEEKEVIETKVEEVETKVEKTEAELAAAKTTKERERIQRRIDKLTAEKKLLEKTNTELQAKLEAKVKEGEVVLTEDDIEKRAKQKADIQIQQQNFDAACNRLADAGIAADKDFTKKVAAMAEDIGPIPGELIGVLDDLDNGGEVLSYLTNNIDEAEEIWKLSLAKQASNLANISFRLINPAKAVSLSLLIIDFLNQSIKDKKFIQIN